MKYLCFLFLLFSLNIQGQFSLSGVVKNKATGKAVPFATISYDTSKKIADINGLFKIISSTPLSVLDVSQIGFRKDQFIVKNNQKQIVISLAPSDVDEHTDVRAQQIIAMSILLRDGNNPAKKLNSYQFKGYNKLLVSANPDSIKVEFDTITKRNFFGKRTQKIDSSLYKFKKIIAYRDLIQTEKASLFQYDGKHFQENILGVKMSGLKKPIYEILGFNLQSYSIYDKSYTLFETKYNSPLAKDALKDYYYQVLDSVDIEGRKTFLIFFKNKKLSRAAGLEGLLFIDSQNYAVAKSIMHIGGVLDISGIHDFTFLEEQQLWWPKKTTFRIVKGSKEEDIRLLGGVIKFDRSDNISGIDRRSDPSDLIYLLSTTVYSDLEINEALKIRRPSIAMVVKESAIDQPQEFWDKYRKGSLTTREVNTYIAMDSLVINTKIEKKLRFGRKIFNGYVPIGAIDLDLRHLLSFNNYEGFRLGLGGVTNERLSEKFRLEGYAAYGTKDGTFKYNFGAATRIGKSSNSWFGASYTNDIREIASTSFAIDKRSFKIYDPRPINISTFYNYKMYKMYIENRILPKTESIWQVSTTAVEPKFNYIFLNDGKSYTSYNMTTAMVSLQWNPFSDFMQTPSGRMEIDKRFPKFTFQFTQALPEIAQNDFEFGKVDLRIEFEKKYLNGQKSSIISEAGYAYGDTPLTHLYNNSPNNLNKDNIIQRITFSGKNAFETMYFNEFFSSQYVMFQLKHGFKKSTFAGAFSPTIVIVSRAAWGNMQKPEQHLGIDYKTLDKGYFESGVEFNQMLRFFGLSAFYRYGPNQLPRFEDNIAIKLGFILDLGF